MTQDRLPLVTIITPSFNQGRFIRDTIESVLTQDYPHIEYIIIDGGSTDETALIVKEYEGRLTWISELDNGQSDAINKGFRMARGEIVAWLNSDDTYCPGAVSTAAAYLAAHPDVGMVYGEGYEIDEEGRRIRRFPYTQEFDLRKLITYSDYILQPTVFMRRDALLEVGLLDDALFWCMDWDLWIRFGKTHRVAYLPDFLANSRIYAETKTASGGLPRFREIARVMRRHGSGRYPLGYFVYGEDTLLTLVKQRAPRFCTALFLPVWYRFKACLRRLLRSAGVL
ncbi:MAG: hypothetical protein OHK006_21280 [Thermodesulfovibrionales bacterium]